MVLSIALSAQKKLKLKEVDSMPLASHSLQSIDGCMICKNCGLAIHKNGDHWFAGEKLDTSEGKPHCYTSNKKALKDSD